MVVCCNILRLSSVFVSFIFGIVLFYTLLMLYFLNPPKLWSAECRFKYLTQTLRLITPALVVWVSCWQTVFLRHLAYLFIHLTFTVEEADGLSLGYKFLTPQGFTASITPICLAELVSVRRFNQWHMNTIKPKVLKAKSLFNEGICMCAWTCV